MRLTLANPVMITPRLCAGVKIGEAYISIECAKRPAQEAHRVRYQYYIDLPDGTSYECDDLESGCHHSIRSGLENLLSFMSACGESYHYELGGGESENADLFPPHIAEFCYQNSDELSSLALELKENPDCVLEGGE